MRKTRRPDTEGTRGVLPSRVPTGRRDGVVLAVLLLALGAGVASAGTPYFRMRLPGADAGGAAGGTPAGDPSSPPATAYDTAATYPNAPPASRFFVVSDPDFPRSTARSQAVRGRYDVIGGVAPYTVRFPRPEPGFDLSASDVPVGGSTVALEGVPPGLGTVQGIPFVVTDSVGATAEYATDPFTVQVPAPISIAPQGDVPAVVPQGSSVRAFYLVRGGNPSAYEATFDAGDPGLTVTWNACPAAASLDPYEGFNPYCSNTFTVSGTPTTTGVNPAMRLTVTDDSGNSGSYVVGPFVVRENGASEALKITPFPDLPSALTLGDSASATYRFSGGTPPYRATVTPLLSGFSSGFATPTDVVTDDGSVNLGGLDRLVVEGAPTRQGLNPPMVVSLTDAAGHAGTFTTRPFYVTGAATPLTVGDASIYSADNYPLVAGSDVVNNSNPYTVFAYGGVPPVTLSVEPNPAGAFFVDSYPAGPGASRPNETDGHLHGSVDRAGTVSGLTLVATDGAGTVVRKTIPDFVAYPTSRTDRLTFVETSDLPATVASGATVSGTFSATGAACAYCSGPPRYSFELDNAPTGVELVQPVPGDPNAVLSGVAGQAGTFRDTIVRVTDGDQVAFHRLPPYTVAKGGSLCVIRSPSGATQYDDAGNPNVIAAVGCGTPPYVASLGPGTSPVPAFVQRGVEAGVFGVTFGRACNGYYGARGCSFPGPADETYLGRYEGYPLTVTDADGLSVTFPPVGFSVNAVAKSPSLTCDDDSEISASAANGVSSSGFRGAVPPVTVRVTGSVEGGPVTRSGPDDGGGGSGDLTVELGQSYGAPTFTTDNYDGVARMRVPSGSGDVTLVYGVKAANGGCSTAQTVRGDPG